MQKDKVPAIDFLKCIGMAGIIIAHSGSPIWAIRLRSFDVPMMVFLSALLGTMSFQRRRQAGKGALHFCIDRTKRILIPTYLFLILYLTAAFLMGERRGLRYILDSFFLTRYGAGYVWIMLIYLFCAWLTPLFERFRASKSAAVLAGFAYLAYECAFALQIGSDNRLMDTLFYQLVPYGCVAFLGARYAGMSERTKGRMGLFFLASCLLCAGFFSIRAGKFIPFNDFKYPPRIYYLSYGLAWTFFLLHVCRTHPCRLFENRGVRFISRHSMWIYFWHIFALALFQAVHFPQFWLLKAVLALAFAVAMTAGVNWACGRIDPEKRHEKLLRYIR